MKALFIFAHPDDETFTSGGTIAKWVKEGREVKLVCATRGEAGQRGDPPVCTQQELPKVREQELRVAAKILGISQIYFLDFIDGTLHEASTNLLENKILEVLKKENPDIVVTFDPGGITNHPDHIAISHASTNAFNAYAKKAGKSVKLYYTVLPQSNLDVLKKAGLGDVSFGGLQATPDAEVTMIHDVAHFYTQKIEAFKCHKSQHQDFEKFLEWGKHIDQRHEHFRLIRENKAG